MILISKGGQHIPTYWNYQTEIQFILEAVKLFQLIGIIRPKFSLSKKRSNYSNLLELSDRDSVYLRIGQIIPTYWNYQTEIQFVSEATKMT